MAEKRDYYEVLGIGRNATDEEIKRSFRKLAFQYHPDHNQNADAETKFKEINEAYEVLSDPEKRATYDRYGHNGPEGIFGRGFDGFDFGGFGSIWEAFFGGATATAARAPERGADLETRLSVSFAEAAFGCEKELSIKRVEICPVCSGIGAKPGSKPVRCSNCSGRGQVRRVQQNVFGRFTNITTCPQCRGEGQIITDPCPECRGRGMSERRRTIMIKVPAGVDHDTQIRLKGEGDAGMRGGSSGNLYVRVSVQPHQFFTRDGDNVLYELPVNFAEAALGSEVEVPTLDGKAKLRVPPGCQSGRVFTLKEKGTPHLDRGGRGDELVTVRVVTPERLTREQKKLFEDLAQSLKNEKS